MEQIANFERPAANDDFFPAPEPVKNVVRLEIPKDVEQSETPQYLFNLA
jgi:hypothetical protein